MTVSGGWKHLLAVLASVLITCHSLVYEEKVPDLLQNCLKQISHKKGNITRDTAESIEYLCTKEYLFKTPEERWHPGLDHVINTETLKEFADLFKDLDVDGTRSQRVRYRYSSVKRHFVRAKRETPIVRKEIRMLTKQERERFFRALNAMKADTSDPVRTITNRSI